MAKEQLKVLEHPEQKIEELRVINVSLAAILDNRRERQDGTYPIKLRLIHSRKPLLLSLGVFTTVDEWEAITETKSRGRQRMAQKICFDGLLKAQAIILQMQTFEPLEFKNRYKGVQTDRTNIWSAFDVQIRQLIEADRISYAHTYEDSKKSFQRFMEDMPKHRISSFNQLTASWLEAYDKWARTKSQTKRALSRSTIGIYTRNLKVLANEAIKAGLMSRNPFHEFKPPTSENIKKALSRGEVEAIMKYSSDNEFRNMYRDLFVFSYMGCGMNFSDILRLRWGQVQAYVSEDGDRKEYISFVRKKTERKRNQVKRSILILPRMRAIIEKWGNPRISDSTNLFPQLGRAADETEAVRIIKQEVKAANTHLKAIANELDVDSSISTYSARHSWASHAAHSGQNIHFIQSQLGHEDSKTTERYLESLGPELLEKSMQFVVGFD